jgi:nitrite reductase/ring-hydroxylating ferredoxin subunit
MSEILVCRSDELGDGAVRIVTIDELEVGLIRHKGRCYAYRNLCVHQGGPVCEGLRLPQVVDVIDAGGGYVQQSFNEDDIHIVCPWHGYEYHLLTGEHVADPRLRLQKFEVSERNGNLYVTT